MNQTSPRYGRTGAAKKPSPLKSVDSARPLVLITNDDGYFSPGILALRARVRRFAEAFVVAPDRERSANSLSLTLRRPLRIQNIKPRVYAVDGTPADCVYMALKKLLPRNPDLLLSGMNLGPNLGCQDIFYSGTVAAAIQGSFLGIPSAAFSLTAGPRGHFDFEGSARFAEEIVRRLLKKRLPAGMIFNINIPPPPVRGIKITKLGQRRYHPEIIDKKDPHDEAYYWIGPGNPESSGDANSDIHAAQNGFISMTPLHTDLTDFGMIGSAFLKTFSSVRAFSNRI